MDGVVLVVCVDAAPVETVSARLRKVTTCKPATYKHMSAGGDQPRSARSPEHFLRLLRASAPRFTATGCTQPTKRTLQHAA